MTISTRVCVQIFNSLITGCSVLQQKKHVYSKYNVRNIHHSPRLCQVLSSAEWRHHSHLVSVSQSHHLVADGDVLLTNSQHHLLQQHRQSETEGLTGSRLCHDKTVMVLYVNRFIFPSSLGLLTPTLTPRVYPQTLPT